MNKTALFGLVVGSAMTVSAAQAEPLSLTLDQMDGVTAAGFGFTEFDAFLFKDADLDTQIDFDKDADVDVLVDISGYLADAQAFANCEGFGCTAETFTGADTSAFFGFGTAASQSVSASN